MNIELRAAILPADPQIVELRNDLEGAFQTLQKSENLVITDRTLLSVQSLFKALDRKDLASPLGDARYLTWLILSLRALSQDGLTPIQQPGTSTFKKLKGLVDSITNLSTALWVPLNLLNKHGPSLSLLSSALGKVAVCRNELDAMQKILGLAIALKERSLSLNLLRTSLEVGRIGAQFLGYEQTSYLIGILSGSIGAYQIWRLAKS